MPTFLPPVPVPATEPPRTRLGRWLLEGGSSGDTPAHPKTWPWYLVVWLTGVDYFSTLGYQPSIAYEAAGPLAPIATMILVAVTIFAALPMYKAVAERSYEGQGSVSMLERLVPGWRGKLMLLVLMGFAITGFVITMTLSAADAAVHVVENPLLAEGFPPGAERWVTLAMLVVLAAVFLRGFREAISIAVLIAVPYIVLNYVVIGTGLLEISRHPDYWERWTADLSSRGGPGAVGLLALLVFPKLALGLSGFETGVTVMPLIRGAQSDPAAGPPVHRIAATRKLLTTAALVMSAALIGSSFVVTLVIPPEAFAEGGSAKGRALSWIAHHYLGAGFGSVYDLSTILILWFAGASAMAALLNLVPPYLPRFGMAPHWVRFPRPLVLLLLAITIAVTLGFDADVEAQGGAYATGVLALFLSASVAVTLAIWREAKTEGRSRWRALPFLLITVLFAFTFVDNVVMRIDGLLIALLFIAAILVLSMVSRYYRATEFRVERMAFATPESEELWPEVQGRKVHLVTVKWNTTLLARKKARLKQHYLVDGPIAWVHVELTQDRSAFDSTVYLRIARLGDDFRITVTNATAVPNTIAYLSELIDPKSIFLGLTRENPVTQSLRYLIWGEGETGILVYQILLRYWNWTEEDDQRPNIFLMSD